MDTLSGTFEELHAGLFCSEGPQQMRPRSATLTPQALTSRRTRVVSQTQFAPEPFRSLTMKRLEMDPHE